MPKVTEGTFALGGLTAFAIWFAVVLPFLYGPASHSGDQKHVAAAQSGQSTNVKPDGSAAAPFVVQVMPSPKSAEERAQEAEEREEKKSADRWLVRWTAALFAATVGLILATGVLGYFGLQQSRDMKASITAANRSADISERSLTELEAPFTAIKIIKTGLTKKTREIGHDFGMLEFSITNDGRTPARLVELVDKTILVPIDAGNPSPIDVNFRSRNTMPYGVISPPSSESQPFSQNLMFNHMNELAAEPAPLKTKAIFFYGFVRYETIFKQTYRMGFCYIFDKFGERWILSGEEKYNYLTKED